MQSLAGRVLVSTSPPPRRNHGTNARGWPRLSRPRFRRREKFASRTVGPVQRCRLSYETSRSSRLPRSRRRSADSARRHCATRSSTSACRRCARAMCAASGWERWSRSTRSTCGSASAACSSSSRSSWRRRRSSASTRTSRPTRIPGSPTRATTSTRRSSASGSTTDSLVVELASNDGYLLQHVVERGIPALGVEPAANVAEAARERGIETVVEFFGRELASRARGRGPAGGPAGGQQRVRPRARPERLRRRHAAAAGARGRGHDRVPASGAADRGEPVRHDLPRALLLLLVPHRARGAGARTGSRCSTSRSCRPTAARCASTRSTPARPARRRPRGRTSWPSASARAGSTGWTATRAFAAAGDGDQVEAARVPDRVPAGRQARSPATARRARATRCSTTAASAPTCSSSRSIATRTSRGSSCPGPTSRSAIPSARAAPVPTTS